MPFIAIIGFTIIVASVIGIWVASEAHNTLRSNVIPNPSPFSEVSSLMSPSPAQSPLSNKPQPFELKVWMIQYIPPNGIGSVYPVAPITDPADFTKNTLIPKLNEASKYHGYSDSSAQPSLNYVLSDTDIVEENNPPPWIDLANGKKRYDYNALFNKYDLCEYAKNNDIKALILWAGGNVETGYGGGMYEAAITGDKGIPTNGAHLPYCSDKTIVVYGFNYERSDTVLEGPGHHLESVWRRFRPEFSSFSDSGAFSGGSYYPPQRGDSCGTIHNPPNATAEYIRINTAEFLSDCRNWKPDGTGIKETLTCAAWNCDGFMWYTWWMQNAPGLGNDLYFNGEKIPNWWVYIGDPDRCVADPLSCTTY